MIVLGENPISKVDLDFQGFFIKCLEYIHHQSKLLDRAWLIDEAKGGSWVWGLKPTGEVLGFS